MTAVVVIEAVAIALLGVLVFGLLRNQAALLAAVRDRLPPPAPSPDVPPPRLPTGPAPAVAGVSPAGEPVRVDTASGAVLVVFLTAGCRECAWWWRALGRPGARLAGLRPVVVTPGPDTESPRAVAQVAPARIPVVMSAEAWADYGVRAASTVVVAVDGAVRAGGRATDWEGLRALLDDAGLARSTS